MNPSPIPTEPGILTTTVGSYPVPDWLSALPSEQAVIDATRVIFDTQRQSGIDLPTDGELSGTARRARGPRFERAHGDDERDDAIFATAEFLQHGDARRGVGTGGVRDCAAARRGEAPRVLQARRSRRARASTHIANGSMSMKDARALCGGVGPGDGGAPKGSS